MANIIQLKRSATASAIPSSGSLVAGELAVNTADGKLYLKKDDASVVQIGAGSGAGLGDANTFTALNSFNAGISAAGATFSSAVNITLNTAPALKIGTHGTKDLLLSSTDGVGLIEQGGAGSAQLTIRQASGGIVKIGGVTNFAYVSDATDAIALQTIGVLYLGDADGANNSTSITIDDTVSNITYSAGQHTFYGPITAPNIAGLEQTFLFMGA
jgi:hypothetical protein